MRRLAALVLLLVTVVVLRRAMTGDSAADLRGTALALGFALIAATLTGELFERLRLPRISGYLIFGLACGPYAADIISRSMASDLQAVNGLAIALIAFIAGLEINVTRLRPMLRRMLTMGGDRGALRGHRRDAVRRLAVAAHRAGRLEPRAPRDDAGHDDGARELLADRDDRGHRREPRARPAQRAGAGGRGPGGPRAHPRVHARDAVHAVHQRRHDG
ncbi:MAG: cation:proton antiporter [Vicinamibacteria bacterium]